MEQNSNIKKRRKCFYKNEIKWHFFGHDVLEEGEICNCKEMIVKNGTVTRLIKHKKVNKEI